jgi:hypothetical protein
MGNPTMVFLGIREFSLEPSPVTEMDAPGFEAVCSFGALEQLQGVYAPDFTHAQAVCVTEVEEEEVFEVVEEYDSPGWYYSLARVLPEAARWVLCFSVVQRLSGKYVLETNTIQPNGDDVFYCFTGATPNGTPVRAVPDFDRLKFLPPRSGAKLALVRAGDWHWDEKRDTVSIRPQDMLEMEIVLDSEVRVL